MSDVEQGTHQLRGATTASANEGRPVIKETYEDTRKVIRELITGLAPRAQADLGFIEKTAAMMQRMDASRTAELNKLAEEEKQLTTQLKRVQQEHTHQTTRLRALGYQQKMTELQKENVEIAKELSELETNANWASGELSNLRNELSALEARSIADELPVGGEVIQLQLYKQAGFQYTPSGDIIVHSSNDVHVIHGAASDNTNDKSPFEKTNVVWELATGLVDS